MVMTFVLYPLSHYNSITESRTHFLLSFLKHLTIDFPSHFILSLIDVFQDSASCDKLIFPFAITRILRHFSVPSPVFDPFTYMCAIDAATIKRSEAQFRSRQQDSTPPSRLTPSRFARHTSAPSSSLSDVSLADIMVQLQRMDTRLDTLSTELYQVNVHVGRIARRQATMGGFAPKATLHHLFLSLLILRIRMMMMVMTMMLWMMMMEMQALPMRCLLDILTICHL